MCTIDKSSVSLTILSNKLHGSLSQHFQLEPWSLLLNFCCFLLGLVVCYSILHGSYQRKYLDPLDHPIGPSLDLFYLSKLPHRSLEELAKKYGPIMYLHLGFLDHIVVSNVEMAMKVLKVHDADFASTPPIIAANTQVLIGPTLAWHHMEIIFAYFARYVLHNCSHKQD